MRKMLQWGADFLLVFTAALCTLGSVTSAYGLPVEFDSLAGTWALTALFCAGLAQLGRGKGLFAAPVPILMALYLNFEAIAAGFKWTVFYITNEYAKWFSTFVIFSGAKARPEEITAFFGFAGVALVLLLTLSVSLWRSSVLTVFLTLPIVALTLAIESCAPDMRYLAGLVAVCLAMLVTSALHPLDFARRGRAVFPALALTLPLMLAAYLIAAPSSHVRGEAVASIDRRIEEMFTHEYVPLTSGTGSGVGLGWPNTASERWKFNTERVEIASSGNFNLTGRELLEVTSSRAGTFYLSGYSMQNFDGRAWSGNSRDVDPLELLLTWASPFAIIQQYAETDLEFELLDTDMTILLNRDDSDLAYIPYYIGNPVVVDGTVETASFYHLTQSLPALADALKRGGMASEGFGGDVNASAHELYTQIDPGTAESLRRIAQQRAGIAPREDTDRAMIADRVASFVSRVARYTLTPAPVPAGEDFPIYFLETAQQGYCIHFATTAAMLLRAFDVPARFTTGFTVTVAEDEVGLPVTITDKQAHAWVEVFYDDLGWVPLEVTPSGPITGIPSGIPHSASGSSGEQETTPEERDERSEPTPAPSRSPQTPSDKKADDTGFWMLVLALALIGGPILRRNLARSRRTKALEQKNTNAAVIYAWKYILRLAGKTMRPPAEIEEIALKARYSLHTLTEDERRTVVNYAGRFAGATDRWCNPFKRFWLRYVLALY